MTTGRRRHLRIALAVLLIGAATVFLALTVVRNWRQLETFDWDVRPVPLVASILLLFVAFAWGVWTWQRVIARLQPAAPSFPALLRIWLLSGLTRYVPGKIWQFVTAGEMGGHVGMARGVVLTSMLVHMVFNLTAAAIAAALLTDTAVFSAPLAAAVALAALLLAHPAPLNLALRLVPRFVHRDVLTWSGTWRDGVVLLVMSFAGWIIYGLAFAVFLSSVIPLQVHDAPRLAGISALSFIAGYLVLLAPAGIGVREGAIAVLLRPWAPEAVAVVLAVLTRLWGIVAEVGGALLMIAWGAGTNRRPRED